MDGPFPEKVQEEYGDLSRIFYNAEFHNFEEEAERWGKMREG